jgi:hypothetical protein
VIDRPDAERAVPDLEMPPRVPGERRGAVSHSYAVTVEALRDPARPAAHVAIVGAMDRPLHRARDHGAIAVLDRRVVDELVAEQRPFLHQSTHRFLPLFPGLFSFSRSMASAGFPGRLGFQ